MSDTENEIIEEQQPQKQTVADLVPAHYTDPQMSMFLDTACYNQSYRAARLLSESRNMIPREYSGNVGNCFLALDTARSLGITLTAFFNWTYFVNGKLGMEAKALIALANKSSKLKSGILFERVGADGKENEGWKAYAEDVDKGLIEEIFTFQMAKDAGWWQKKDSWWPRMKDMMCRYRAASFLVKFNRPELLAGMDTVEDLRDGNPIDITGEVDDLIQPGKPLNADKVKKRQQAIKKRDNRKKTTEVIDEPEPSKESKPKPIKQTENKNAEIVIEKAAELKAMSKSKTYQFALLKASRKGKIANGGALLKLCKSPKAEDLELIEEYIAIIKEYKRDPAVKELESMYHDSTHDKAFEVMRNQRGWTDDEFGAVFENDDVPTAQAVIAAIKQIEEVK